MWSHLTLCILLVNRAKIIYMSHHGSEPMYVLWSMMVKSTHRTVMGASSKVTDSFIW